MNIIKKFREEFDWRELQYDKIMYVPTKETETFILKVLSDQKKTLCLEYDKQYLEREEKLIKKIRNQKKEIIKKIEEMKLNSSVGNAGSSKIYPYRLWQSQLLKDIISKIN